jgi:outer membrane protein assembly factor BamB
MKRCFLLAVFLVATSAQAQEKAHWPQFRGPDGRGIALEDKTLPVNFGPGKNQLWKVTLPPGVSSPCIWGERIFLTGHDEKANKLETLCLDRRKGDVLWRQAAPTDKIDKVYKINSPASATPASDGRRVYVSFGSYGLLCYDREGKELWRRPLPRPPARFGPATSPVVVGDLVLLNSQGKDLHLAAFRAEDGTPVWNTEGTPFASDYPVPLIWKNDGVSEVIIPGRGGLLAYDLKDGSRRWWVPGLSPEVACSPTLGEGFLFVASHMPGGDPEMRMKLPAFEELLEHDKNKDGKIGRTEIPKGRIIFSRGGKEGVGDIQMEHMFWLFDKNGDGQVDAEEWLAMLKTPFTNSLLAIRPGGLKDISGTHVAWQAKRGVPEVPSPLYYQGHIYMVRNGVLTCLIAKSGKEAYAPQRLSAGGLYYASPVAGDGKIYVVSDDGVLTVVKAGPRFEVLAENELGATVRATPALADGTLYVRTLHHLYAFRE